MIVRRTLCSIVCAGAICASAHSQAPVGSAFTYQGQLTIGGAPYSGAADLQFRLYDAASGPAQIGGMSPAPAVNVVDGAFSATIDFGPLAFNGEARWLEIDVRTPAGGAGSFTTLAPRQKLAAVPYALHALAATIAGTQPNAVDFTNAANSFSGGGAGLTGLNASSIALGNLNAARMPTGGTWSLTSPTTISGQTFGSMVTIQNTEDDPSGALQVISNTNSGAAIVASAGQQSAAAIIASNAHPNGYGINVFAPRNYIGGRLGIGTFNPATPLHVQINSAGLAPIANSTLALEANASHYLSMLAPNASESGVLFAQPAGGVSDAGIIYNHPATPNGLQLRTGGNQTRMSISDTGRVLVTSSQSGPSMMGVINASDQPSGINLSTNYRTWFVGQNKPYDNPFLLDTFYIYDSDSAATRLLIDLVGNVGIGTTTPTARLDVNGAIKAASFDMPATTRHLSIPSAGFGPADSNMNFDRAAPFINGTTMNQFVVFTAPVNLPDNAVITAMDVEFTDDSLTTNVTATLKAWTYPSTIATDTLASVTSSGASGLTQRLSTSSISLATVNNNDRTYLVEVSWTVPNSVITDAVRLYRVLISYTVTSPLP